MAKRGKSKLGPPYAAPPIFECVMELRFREAAKPNFVEKAARRLKDFYEHSRTEQLVNYEVRLENGAVQTDSSQPTPVIRLTSDDQTDTCSVMVDKVFWGRLAPYSGWEEFSGRIDRDLAAFKRDVDPRRLARIGLRYRNRIDVPVDEEKQLCHYEEYLRVKIDLPDFLDPTEGFEWRVKKDFKDLGLSAVIMSGVMEPQIPMMGAFLLDIDISAEVDDTVSRADIPAMLAKMRKLKNQIFESSVTDVARKSFQ